MIIGHEDVKVRPKTPTWRVRDGKKSILINKTMRNSRPLRLFIALGVLLWIPILIGIIAMVDLRSWLTILTAVALGSALTGTLVNTLIRCLL